MECTVNRVGEDYLDQLELSGHHTRPDDLERFAALGISAFRYPVLWETVAPLGLSQARWSLADQGLRRLRELGVRPIVGLVHHGSGPRSTSLLDSAFPERLAAYARAVAERYPWVAAYTPVNEPLTTARFSALYGHWYPHAADDASFLRALLNQSRGVVLAMRAIRAVRSDAVLVQTDDLGKTFSTPALLYQAEFENERRWLTFDLLCGRVGQEHPLWGWLRSSGLEERELAWFSQNPCPPDVVGINHYLSSERFLDEDLDRYPKDAHGGNGRDRYADVLAARVLADGPTGPKGVLREAWLRYGLPLAVTEAHNGCTRDEQLRWLAEVWDAAASLRGEGIGVRAVTAWSLLGAFGWDELACASGGRYEPGVFDVRSPKPRPTALAAMLRALAARSGYDHPVLDTRGWWRTPERIRYGDPSRSGPPDRRTPALPRHLVIVGARGTLGRVFARVCRARNLPHHLVARDELDIASEASVERALDALRPWAVVNAAGYVRVDDAESDEPRCFRENADGASTLAAGCSRRDVALVTFSSDLVFDGNKGCRYLEDDAVAPLSVYGRSKAEGERRVLETYPKALVVRTSAFFGPWDEHNFVTVTLAALERGEAVAAAADWVVTPTYVPALVDATLDLLIDGESGLWHLANQDAVTWAGLAERAAAASGVVRGRIEPRATADLDLAAPRPRDSALGSRRASLLGPLDEVLERYVGDRERSSRQVPGLAVQQR